MNRRTIVLLAAGLLLLVSCNLFTSTGKVKISINENRKWISDLDTLEIWCPYNYYCITWQVFLKDNGEVVLGSSGLSKGDYFWGSFRYMNNHLYTSVLNTDSLNKVLEKIEVEKPQIIWLVKYFENDSILVTGKEFILFTKDKNIYNNKDRFIEIAKQYN